jgi:hypothetical protein
MARVVRFHATGGPELLKIEELASNQQVGKVVVTVRS